MKVKGVFVIRIVAIVLFSILLLLASFSVVVSLIAHFLRLQRLQEIDNVDPSFILSKRDNVYISKFGSHTFKCSGSCFCEDYGEERRSVAKSNVFKGITYLVTAASSYLAFNQAKKYFDRECQRKLSSEDCSFTDIRSEVDTCERLKYADIGSFDSKHDETVNQWEKDFEEVQVQRYFDCVGSCIPMKVPDVLVEDGTISPEIKSAIEKMTKHFTESYFQCENIQVSRHLNVDIPKEDWFSSEKGSRIEASGIELAESVFMEMILDPECQQNSLIDWENIKQEDLPFDQITVDTYTGKSGPITSRTPFCLGFRAVQGKLTPENPTVKCTETKKLE